MRSKWFSAPLLLLLAYLCNGYFVFHKAVDLPLLDEWDCWWSWKSGEILPWLFSRHNEHRIVFTKLEFLLVDFVARGNEIVLNAIDYLLFGVLVIAVYKIINWLDRSNRWSGWFVVFLLSSLPYENHTWGFQSQFHYTLLFFWLSLPFLFTSEKWSSQLIGVILLVASAYAFSAGVAICVAVLFVYCCFKLSKKNQILPLVAILLIATVALLFWSVGFHRPEGHPQHFFPWQGRFWPFYFTMISYGFGVGKSGTYWGAVALTLCLSAWGIAGIKLRKKNLVPWWVGMAAVCGILAATASVCSGRAGFELWVAKSSRYTEMSLMLVPLTAVGLGLALGGDRKGNWVLGGLLFCLAITFSGKFSPLPYNDEWARRARGQSCVNKYLKTGLGNAYCPDIFPVPLDGRLKRLEQMHPSFMDSIKYGM